MHFCKLLLSSLLFVKICTGKEAIQHNLPEGVELVDPQSLGLNSDIDLDKLLGNVKLLPISGNQLPKQNGLKTQILTVGFDGDENINLDDFELPPLGDTASEKPIAEAAFKSFKDFFKNPNKSVSFEEGTKTQLNKDIQEYGTKTGKILSGQRTTVESTQSPKETTKYASSAQTSSRPSGTLRRRIKKPKTTTEQPKVVSGKTTVAIEPPTANSFNQFDLPNYGLPAGQSPKVIELGQEQIEKLLASGKLTKSQGSGPQVIELGEEQLEDLLREHSKDNPSSGGQVQIQTSTSTTVATTVRPTQVYTTTRPIQEFPTTTKVQESPKQSQTYSPPPANVIQNNYHENKPSNVNINSFNPGQTGQRINNANDFSNVVLSNGLRQGNLVGNQLVPVYHFNGPNQSPNVVLHNNPQIQHGFQPILQPSNLITTPVTNIINNGNILNEPRPQQHQQQHQQQQQQQRQQQQQQHQHLHIPQFQPSNIPHQQQQLQQQQQQNTQSQSNNNQQSNFEVISAPPVSFSSSSEPIQGSGGINTNLQQQRQVANSNGNIQPQQLFLNNHNINGNQFHKAQQNNVRSPSQVVNTFHPNANTLPNSASTTNANVNNYKQNSNTNDNRQNQSPQKSNVGQVGINNNIGLNIVRPPLQSQRLITPSPYIIHQVLNQIPSSFNPTLTAKHVVTSPVLDPSVTFRQDPLPSQQQIFGPNSNRQQTGQIHFPGNQRIRQRDQIVANSNHADALRFGQNYNLQYQGPVRQSQVIGQFSSPFYNPHRDLAGI